MRNRPYHHGDLRAALLEQAERTLRAKGEAALSLRELARDLGVSHAAPSRHFTDRRALLDALAITGFDRMTARLTEADPGPDNTFRERLTALARASVEFAMLEPEIMALMFSRKRGTDADEMREAWMRLDAPVFSAIADGQRSGDVHEGDVKRIAVSAFVTVIGVANLVSIGVVDKDEIAQTLDDALEHLFKGLMP